MIVYFDTSALVKLYVDEPRAKPARDAAKAADVIVTSMLTYAEMRSAFARKRRFGEITLDQLGCFKEEFETDWNTFDIVGIEETIVRRAGDFAENYLLKGFDAVHLATADSLGRRFGDITFACFDTELSRAASACGMTLLPPA